MVEQYAPEQLQKGLLKVSALFNHDVKLFFNRLSLVLK